MSAHPLTHEPAVPADEIVRYTYRERICHWLTGFSYLYCLMTGLAFYTPYLYWMAAVWGGGPTSRFWHPWIGLLFLVGIGWMHNLWRADMATTDADRVWLKNVEFYITNQDDRVPAQERFNAGQKLFYWVMYFGGIVLLLSGLVMWFPEYLPFGLAWVRSLAIIIHECAALVTIGAFIIHVYMGVFMVPGGLKAITVGHVSRAWARTHHRLWAEKVTGENATRE
jgi:formate dehydrogenase subunit gamma